MNLALVSPNQNAYSETFIQAHKNIPGVTVKYYYQGFVPTMLEGKGPLVLERPNTLIRRFCQKFKQRTAPSDLSSQELAFLNSLKIEEIGCVLAEYGPTGVGVMNVCKKLSIPLITHFHGFDSSHTDVLEKYKSGYGDLFQYASAIIAVSRAMENKLLMLGCPENKIHYTPCGPNNIFFDINPKLSKKLLIGVGRFVDKKAPYYTILAFNRVLKSHPDALLIIAGNGPLHNTCKNLTKHLNIEGSVYLPGVITPAEFIQYLNQAIAFVQHSITAADGDMEGTPVGVSEASAAGLPVISTFHAGIPDIILHGKTGLLVEEHDVEGMAENMIRVLDDIEYARELGKNGKIRMLENFSMQHHLGILSEVIQSAVHN